MTSWCWYHHNNAFSLSACYTKLPYPVPNGQTLQHMHRINILTEKPAFMHLETHTHKTSKEKCAMNFKESKEYIEVIKRISKWIFSNCTMLSIPCRNVMNVRHTISPSLPIPTLLPLFTSHQISIPHPGLLDSLLLLLCDSRVLAQCEAILWVNNQWLQNSRNVSESSCSNQLSITPAEQSLSYEPYSSLMLYWRVQYSTGHGKASMAYVSSCLQPPCYASSVC